jgi:hypothetical protein
MHEGGIGAVLQQAAHQVGQQVAVLAHGRVDAAGDAAVLQHLAVDTFAHAVQALHFKGGTGGARHLHDGRDGAGVVAGELRVDDVGMLDQRAGAGQVGDVGVLLVREHRVVGQAQLLGALDLAIPVGALDQAHHEAQPVLARDGGHFVHHGQCAGLVGLHGQAKAAPLRVALGDAGGQGVQHVERQLQAVDLLGVDGEVDVGLGGQLDQLPHARQQLGKHALALQHLVAAEQRAELDGDAVRALRRLGAAAGADGLDGVDVSALVAARVVFGAGALAEHVVAEAELTLLLSRVVGLAHRLADVAAQHELPAQQLDGPHRGGHHGLRAQALEEATVIVRPGQEALGHRDRRGRQRRQHLVRAAFARTVEIRAAELVGGQRDGGGRVGHAQQGFGQAHQGQALGAGDGVLAQQRLHRPERRRVAAHLLHPGARHRDDLGPVQRAADAVGQGVHHTGFGPVGVGQAGLFGRGGEGHGHDGSW